MQNNITNEKNLINLTEKYHKLCDLLTYEEVLVDKKLYLNLEKQKNTIEPIVSKYLEYTKLCKELNQTQKLCPTLSVEERQLFDSEIAMIQSKIEVLVDSINQLSLVLYAQNQQILVEVMANRDDLSIRLANDIKYSYINFCKLNKFDVEENDGYLSISGIGAKEYFETQMGVHTALKDGTTGVCNICIYSYTKAKVFDEDDVKITTCRSSGAGGQHINTTDSSIKATHIPTNIVAICQNERSQIQNRNQAMANLKQKVEEYYISTTKKEIDSQRKAQLKTIKSSKPTQTYDYNKGIVTNSSGNTIKLEKFLSGNII